MTDDIKLPALPRLQVPRIEADVSLIDIKVLARWCERIATDHARAAVLADRASRSERLAEALRGWWEAHRPVGWTEDQHRSCPHVNLATDAEKALATALLREQEEGH